MALALIILWSFNVESSLRVQNQHNVWSIQTYECPIWGSSMVHFTKSLLHRAFQVSWLTELRCRKIPWRLSKFQKARQRKRLRAVDTVVAVVDRALSKQGITTKAVERWKEEMPVEQEMVPKDKYTIFDRKEKKYRKSIRSEFVHIESSEER
jgi:hypothetical protein